MRRVFYILLAVAGLSLLHVSCEKDNTLPLQDEHTGIGHEIALMKAELDREILEVIRSTGQPFDWNRATVDQILRALIVTGYPLVVGYVNHGADGRANRNDLLNFIYASEGKEAARVGYKDDVLVHQNERLGYFHVKVERPETIEGLRSQRGLRYVELAGYPILLDEIAAHYDNLRTAAPSGPAINARDMILDPYQEDPDYFSQVQAYSGSMSTCFRRHNVDDVYRHHQVYGENTGIAILDNGLLPEYQAIMNENGYGSRTYTGYYNPLWFFPWTEPDGATPQTPDVLFLSQFIEGQWLHGWEQSENVLVASPNSAHFSVRASPLVLILVPAQTIGIINSIMAMADEPDVKIISMSMGSLFRIRQMEDAIDYFHSRDKIMVSAAGTSLFFTRELIGVVFPASYEPVLAITGIKNREETGGYFVLGDNSHGGTKVDFSVENNSSSSGATSRFAGMLGLVWSANPALSREEVIDIVIQSSNFYQELGTKFARFGWGAPDILEAVELALEP
jgi:hypothetical protein